MFGGFTHVSGELPGTEDLDISLAAVLLSESCNIPLTEVTLGSAFKADEPLKCWKPQTSPIW